ncbi:hypothetical protein EMQ_1669 [Acetobacter aceti NBRC 14818]|uniref:Uncharacterized protein n=1 Tax=Acetobacter aceti NBRC 14818 TaxID=887700 RepID=A0AB33IDC3_ACEAC|nr:hypothetical protein EMQ_1669 [Acetobacter aceti NBRC 14818]
MEVASLFRYPAQITEAGQAGPDVEQNDMEAGQGIMALQLHAQKQGSVETRSGSQY